MKRKHESMQNPSHNTQHTPRNTVIYSNAANRLTTPLSSDATHEQLHSRRRSRHSMHESVGNVSLDASMHDAEDVDAQEMTYEHQMRRMRVLLGRLLHCDYAMRAEESQKETHNSSEQQHDATTTSSPHSTTSTHTPHTPAPPPHILRQITTDPILSRDALFINLRHIIVELEWYGREVLGVSQVATLANSTDSVHHAFCQTMQAFTCAIQRQKDALMREMCEFEREAVEMLQQDEMFLFKASVMQRGGSSESTTEPVTHSQLKSTNANPHPPTSTKPPPLLSEVNVRRKLLHLHRHLKYLHSLMRRALDKYENVVQQHESTRTRGRFTDTASSTHSPSSSHSTLHASELSAAPLPHYQIATYILNLLYDELLHYESLKSAESASSIYKMLLELFLDTTPPYLEFLDNWLFNGDTSNDYYQEFIVVRNANMSRMRGTGEYWSKFFQVRDLQCVPEFLLATVGENGSTLMQKILLTGKSIHLMQYIEREKVHIGEEQEELYHKESADRPTLREAFLISLEAYSREAGGKSGGVVSIGMGDNDEWDAPQHDNHDFTTLDNDLHLDEFTDPHNTSHFSVFQADPSSPVPVGSLRYSSPRTVKRSHFSSTPNLLSVTKDTTSRALTYPTTTPTHKDDLMQILLNTFSTTPDTNAIPNSLFSFSNQISPIHMVHHFDEEPIDDLVEQLTKPTLEEYLQIDKVKSPDTNTLASVFMPFSELLRLSLYSHIREQYLRVSPYVVNLLFRQCKLMHHFAALRAIYLMECGDIMHFFSTQLFELDQKSMGLMDEYNQLELNAILQESLQFGVEHPRRYTERDEEFDIFAGAGSIRVQDRVKILMSSTTHGWHLTYHAEYPLNTIISTDAIDAYNSILKLLLEISQCKYLLDHIRLPRHGAVEIRHAQILLYQMRQFVNTLHQYIKTRVVEECWKEFLGNLSEATDLDCIIRAHNDYLASVQQKCLLKGPPPIFLKEIRNILQLGVLFHKKCETFVDKYRVNEVVEAQDTFEAFNEREALKKRLNNGVTRVQAEFESHVRTLEGLLQRLLKRGIHPELRDLEMRLDFNGFYRGGVAAG